MILPDDGLIMVFSFQHSSIKAQSSGICLTSMDSIGRKGRLPLSDEVTLFIISVMEIIYQIKRHVLSLCVHYTTL